MALKTCRECGREVSSRAGTCPGCGAPVSPGSGFLGNVIVLAILVGVGWYFFAPAGSLEKVRQMAMKSAPVQESAAATPVPGVHHRSDPGFPAGNYKFGKATSILLKPDGTFRVASPDNQLWNCEGTWTFEGDTLSMQSNPDESTRRAIPEFFYTPARLESEEGSFVVWECNFKTHKWERREP